MKHVTSLRDAGQANSAYFFFDIREKDKKQELHNFFTCLLEQLSTHSTPCHTIISHFYSTQWNGTKQPSIGALMNCLREMLLAMAQQPIYIIVDAVDECHEFGTPTPREVVLSLLEGLVHLRLPNLRICVTSRWEVEIKDVLGSLASGTVSLQDEIGQAKDISDYVRNFVHKKMWRWRSDDKQLVIELLSKNANGM